MGLVLRWIFQKMLFGSLTRGAVTTAGIAAGVDGMTGDHGKNTISEKFKEKTEGLLDFDFLDSKTIKEWTESFDKFLKKYGLDDWSKQDFFGLGVGYLLGHYTSGSVMGGIAGAIVGALISQYFFKEKIKHDFGMAAGQQDLSYKHDLTIDQTMGKPAETTAAVTLKKGLALNFENTNKTTVDPVLPRKKEMQEEPIIDEPGNEPS